MGEFGNNPVFILKMPERDVKIYANGFVEGAPKGTGIMNHLPLLLNRETLEFFSKSPFEVAKEPDSTIEEG